MPINKIRIEFVVSIHIVNANYNDTDELTKATLLILNALRLIETYVVYI